MRACWCAVVALSVCPAWLRADGTTPKPKPTDYPVSNQAGSLMVAADYLVRSFGGDGPMFWTPDYLVVEVALYPARRGPVTLTHSWFRLRLNGKKETLSAQPPPFVAASLKYADWEYPRRGVEAGAGAGDVGVIVGRPTPTERFPGDPTGRSRLPAPPRAPEAEDRSGVEKTPAKTAPEFAVDAALPEGERVLPVAGYLYFEFKGKPKSIKSLELLVNSPEGTATLKLK